MKVFWVSAWTRLLPLLCGERRPTILRTHLRIIQKRTRRIPIQNSRLTKSARFSSSVSFGLEFVVFAFGLSGDAFSKWLVAVRRTITAAAWSRPTPRKLSFNENDVFFFCGFNFEVPDTENG